MSDSKNASEVLVDILKVAEEIKAIVSDTNANVKLILNKQNVQNRVTATPVVTPQPVVSLPPEAVPQPSVEVPTNKASLVEQTILYKSDQRPVALAEVKITDIQTGSFIEKVNTSPGGKWHVTLPKGNFRVEVKKGPIPTQKAFIERFDIEVTGSGAPLLLERKLV